MSDYALIDTHAHIQFDHFEEDRDAVVRRAAEAGVRTTICVGTDLQSSVEAIALAQQYETIAAAVGIQPASVPEMDEEDWDEVVRVATDTDVCAVGESGLDPTYEWSPIEGQRRLFERHIALSVQTGKPLIVHCRKAGRDVLEMLESARGQIEGVQHCFSENVSYARRILDLGFYISFTGIISRKGYKRLKEAAAFTPADRLLIETDCPYMTPVGAPSKRNEPANVRLVLEALASLRGEDGSELARRTTENAERLFGLHQNS